MKKVVLALTIIALLAAFAACNSSTQEEPAEMSQNTAEETGAATPAETDVEKTTAAEPLKVAMVCSGSLGGHRNIRYGKRGAYESSGGFWY